MDIIQAASEGVLRLPRSLSKLLVGQALPRQYSRGQGSGSQVAAFGDSALLSPGADHSDMLRLSTSGVWREKEADPPLQDSDEMGLGALDRGKSVNKRQGAPTQECVQCFRKPRGGEMNSA